MKIPVDELLYSICECTFYCDDNEGCELYSFPTDDEYSPMYWNVNKIFSDDNPHQCERFIEYRKFIELRKENN